MTATSVEAIKFTDVDEPDKTMEIDIMSDGGVSIVIEDRYGGAYNNGSSEGISLTAAQVNQLREALS